MRDDDVAAQSLGINLVSKKISIFCISAFFAGVAGALWGPCAGPFISGQFFYFTMSFKVVQISIIGRHGVPVRCGHRRAVYDLCARAAGPP